MEVVHPPVAFEDDRGRIIDVLQALDFNSATLITTRKGVTRGNHSHKLTTQWVYILRGRMLAHSRLPGGNATRAELNAGDLLKNVPGEDHALTALEDTEFLVLSSGPRSGVDYEKDTYRLDQPLHEPEASTGAS